MSKSVHEIMNREVLMLRAGEAADSALGFLNQKTGIVWTGDEPFELAAVARTLESRAKSELRSELLR